MSQYREPTSSADLRIDWDEVRALLRRHLAQRVGSADRDSLDDLIQEASIRLLRAARRSKVENLDALASTIARRTWVDFVRRRVRWRRIFSENTEWQAVAMPGGSEWGDLRDRLQFVVLALFDREGSDACSDLARAYFAELDWKTVAGSLNQSYSSVRKRWSRCVEEVRRHMGQDPDLGRLLKPKEG